MKKIFRYFVEEVVIDDIKAFGEGWRQAKEIASERHCGIRRAVIKDGEERYEFYAGGTFINEKFADKFELFIF